MVGQLDPARQLDGAACARQGLAQYDAAEEWTVTMGDGARRRHWKPPRTVQVHRAGDLDSRVLRRGIVASACEELRPYLRRELGWPLTGDPASADIEGAEQALLAAHGAGWYPEPGLALVQLAQGDIASAVASIRNAVERPLRAPSKELPPDTELQRAPLLEAQVEIELAAGNLDEARDLLEELQLVAARFQSKALVAGATLAQERCGSRRVTRWTRERLFAEAARLWDDVGAPYEAALARLGLADALQAGGNERQADVERRAARTVLDGIEVAPPAKTAAHDPSAVPRGRLLVAGVRGRTRVRDLKGMHYLARLSPTPAVSSTCSTSSPPKSVGVARLGEARPPMRAPPSAMPARCSTTHAKSAIADASQRSTTTSRRRAPSETPGGSCRRTPNATSLFESLGFLQDAVPSIRHHHEAPPTAPAIRTA